MPQAVRVVTFDETEKGLLSSVSKAQKAQEVGSAVSALIKESLSAVTDIARKPQADPESLNRAHQGLDQTARLLDALPGNLVTEYKQELADARQMLQESLDLLN